MNTSMCLVLCKRNIIRQITIPDKFTKIMNKSKFFHSYSMLILKKFSNYFKIVLKEVRNNKKSKVMLMNIPYRQQFQSIIPYHSIIHYKPSGSKPESYNPLSNAIHLCG